jgi:hypothetical protein
MAKDVFKLSESEEKGSATLVVKAGALEVFHLESFGDHCDRLLATGRKLLILDLRMMHNIRSRFIGLIIKLADDARGSGRRAAVLATKRVAQMLAMFADEVGLDVRTEGPATGE